MNKNGSKQFLLHILHVFLYVYCIFCIAFFLHDIIARGGRRPPPEILYLYYVKNMQKVYKKYKTIQKHMQNM